MFIYIFVYIHVAIAKKECRVLRNHHIGITFRYAGLRATACLGLSLNPEGQASEAFKYCSYFVMILTT